MSKVMNLIGAYEEGEIPVKGHLRKKYADEAADEFEELVGQRDQAWKELEEYKKLSGIVACAYCGHESPKSDPVAILEHTMTCEKRPEKKLLEKAFAIEDGLFSKLDHVATSGYHLDGCEVCDAIRKALEVWHSEP